MGSQDASAGRTRARSRSAIGLLFAPPVFMGVDVNVSDAAVEPFINTTTL